MARPEIIQSDIYFLKALINKVKMCYVKKKMVHIINVNIFKMVYFIKVHEHNFFKFIDDIYYI